MSTARKRQFRLNEGLDRAMFGIEDKPQKPTASFTLMQGEEKMQIFETQVPPTLAREVITTAGPTRETRFSFPVIVKGFSV